jgi:hypothetical protein
MSQAGWEKGLGDCNLVSGSDFQGLFVAEVGLCSWYLAYFWVGGAREEQVGFEILRRYVAGRAWMDPIVVQNSFEIPTAGESRSVLGFVVVMGVGHRSNFLKTKHRISWRPSSIHYRRSLDTLAATDIFGIVQSGFLKISGLIRHGQLDVDSHESRVVGDDGRFFGVASLSYSELPGPVIILLLFTPTGYEPFYLLLRETGRTDANIAERVCL